MSLETDGISFAYRDVGGLRLHVAEAGPEDGPLVILLHGFPEFWFGWREQIRPLAEAGFRVVAPDQRGYNLSDKPKGAWAYGLDGLAGDIFGLADSYGRETFRVVGHDWGASVAWWMATKRPERLERLAILNAPHPGVWLRAMTQDPEQRRRSRYVQLLRLPWLPEALVRLGGYRSLADAFAGAARPQAFGTEAMARYHEAWRRPDALTATLNWYRALFLQPVTVPPPESIPTSTLVLWGDLDPFAEPDLAEASAALCANARVRHFPNATHWVAHDEPEAVSRALVGFLS
ncbi:MAG TPA: alpha/beta fold hydrolase [Phenylobacterium sp.]|nr:alpha/beta fold hydrolase [Phenylobacterium sp.]